MLAIDLQNQDDVLKIRREFAAVTQNFMSDFRDYAAILCKDVLPDGTKLNGQTAFFRNFAVFREIIKSMKHRGQLDSCRILAAPSSIGCEAYGFAGLALSYGLKDFTVEGFDCSQRFTDLAQLGVYPGEIVRRLEGWRDLAFPPAPKDRSHAEPLVPVSPEVAGHVNFLPAQRFENFKPEKAYDIVMVGNLFQHITAVQREECLDVIRQTQARVVIFTKAGAEDLDPIRYGYTNVSMAYPEWGPNEIFNDRPFLQKMYGIWTCAPR